jgi:hypothetical protein
MTGVVHHGDGGTKRVGHREIAERHQRDVGALGGTKPSDARVVALRIAVGGREPPIRPGTARAACSLVAQS